MGSPQSLCAFFCKPWFDGFQRAGAPWREARRTLRMGPGQERKAGRVLRHAAGLRCTTEES